MSNNEVLLKIQEALQQTSNEELLPLLVSLRNFCAKGSDIQFAVAANDDFNFLLNSLLFNNDPNVQQVKKIAWQIIANTIVNNTETQKVIWTRYGENIKKLSSTSTLDCNTNVQLMIIYNILRGGTRLITQKDALQFAVEVWRAVHEQKCSLGFDFLHFIFEHFLVENGRETIQCYEQLPSEDKIAFLDYLVSYLRNDSPNGNVHTFILQHLAKQFKIKSDCVLRQNSESVNKLHPREVHSLLQILASTTGSEKYENVFSSDHALFLNVSSLLRCLVAAGKENNKNMFTPMRKLEEVALTSEVSSAFESEISFEMKTLLVRCVANLLYNNKVNQGYCLDTQLMPTLFECTNMDARNPLMKEWSILAIRNACIGCPEIQEIIANLIKHGDAPNDLLNELNLDMGALRINGNVA